jgi:hypothetical protein
MRGNGKVAQALNTSLEHPDHTLDALQLNVPDSRKEKIHDPAAEYQNRQKSWRHSFDHVVGNISHAFDNANPVVPWCR